MYYETETNYRKTQTQWMQFNNTPEISTYQVTFCLLSDKWINLILSFQYRNEINDVPIGLSKIIVWNRNKSHLIFAIEVIEKVAKSFKNDWKNLEKISIIQFVLMPGFRHNNIEKWGLILYE